MQQLVIRTSSASCISSVRWAKSVSALISSIMVVVLSPVIAIGSMNASLTSEAASGTSSLLVSAVSVLSVVPLVSVDVLGVVLSLLLLPAQAARLSSITSARSRAMLLFILCFPPLIFVPARSRLPRFPKGKRDMTGAPVMRFGRLVRKTTFFARN